MELKTDNSHYEYIVKESVGQNIVTWECLPDIELVKKYLKKHPFPKDKLYSKQEFLADVKNASGYIHLWVQRAETADFICELIYELI